MNACAAFDMPAYFSLIDSQEAKGNECFGPLDTMKNDALLHNFLLLYDAFLTATLTKGLIRDMVRFKQQWKS